MKWWEKTVEYMFVVSAYKHGKLYLPLDGNEERAGDTILSSQNKWVLIEFKKDRQSISDEQSKFTEYERAKAALGSEDHHHFLVYGDQDMASRKLVLRFCKYFSGKQSNLQGLLKSGAVYDKFADYLKRFTEFKRGRSGSSSGGLSMDDFALIASINNDGKIVECLSLSTYFKSLTLEEKNDPDYTQGGGGPQL